MAFADCDKILLFGDSLTEQSYEQSRGFGFGAAITDAYKRKLDVVSRGFGGYNTRYALKILPQIIPPPSATSRIRLMTVFFGANDAVQEGQLQHVPLDQYRENLKKIVTHEVLKPHDPKFILITPPPICEYTTQDEDKKKGRDYIQRLAPRTKMYADTTLAVGKELGIPVANLWEAFMNYAGGLQGDKPLPGSKDIPKNEKLASLLRDGLHFNPKGYEIMYEEVMKIILSSYPEFDPEKLEFVFPHWEEALKETY